MLFLKKHYNILNCNIKITIYLTLWYLLWSALYTSCSNYSESFFLLQYSLTVCYCAKPCGYLCFHVPLNDFAFWLEELRHTRELLPNCIKNSLQSVLVLILVLRSVLYNRLHHYILSLQIMKERSMLRKFKKTVHPNIKNLSCRSKPVYDL